MTATSGMNDTALGSTGNKVSMRGPNAQKVVLTVRKLQDAP